MSSDDPIRKVQRLSRPALPKRFYKTVAYATVEEGYALLLDGKPLRTPMRRALIVPCPALAEALVAEWQAQATVIDPSTMPVTRLANVAIDGVADRPDEVRAEIVAYAGNDLICYRADEPDGLAVRQEAAWQPLVAWAEEALGARLRTTVGIVHVDQEAAALAAIEEAVARLDFYQLAAMHTLTTLTGSAVIALALCRRRLRPEEAWAAAFVDEDWQIGQWGDDAEAAANRARRRREFDAAVLVLGGVDH